MKVPQCKVCNSVMLNLKSFSEHEQICSDKCLELRIEMMKMNITDQIVRYVYGLKKAKKIKNFIKGFAQENNYKKKFVAKMIYERGDELGLSLVK